MTSALPHRYEISLTSVEGQTGELSAPPRPTIMGGPPPEFGGQEGWWSPEHLLLASAGLCLMATFKAMAGARGLKVTGYRTRAEGTLDKTEGLLAFTGIRLRVALTVAPEERDRAEKLLQAAKKHCIIANSLKTPVALETEVSS